MERLACHQDRVHQTGMYGVPPGPRKVGDRWKVEEAGLIYLIHAAR